MILKMCVKLTEVKKEKLFKECCTKGKKVFKT
jgi:hypothetical protein